MSGLGLYGGAGVEDADAGVNINVECCFVLYTLWRRKLCFSLGFSFFYALYDYQYHHILHTHLLSNFICGIKI